MIINTAPDTMKLAEAETLSGKSSFIIKTTTLEARQLETSCIQNNKAWAVQIKTWHYRSNRCLIWEIIVRRLIHKVLLLRRTFWISFGNVIRVCISSKSIFSSNKIGLYLNNHGPDQVQESRRGRLGPCLSSNIQICLIRTSMSFIRRWTRVRDQVCREILR